MANKAQLLAKAQELQIEVPEGATNAQIKELIDSNTVVEDDNETPEQGVYVDSKGLKFRFKESTPSKLQIDGKVYPIAQIINDDELMQDLVESRAIFIEQIYK